MKYDVEDFLDMTLSIMTTGGALNAKIAAVEAEKAAAGKGVTPTLAPIDSGSYHLQSWSEKVLQTTPAIFYGIEDVTTKSSGAQVNAKTYKIFIEVIYVDSGMTNDASKRILRYARALEELFAEQFKAAAEVGTVTIEQVRPIAFKLELDSNEEIKVGGISLTINMV